MSHCTACILIHHADSNSVDPDQLADSIRVDLDLDLVRIYSVKNLKWLAFFYFRLAHQPSTLSAAMAGCWSDNPREDRQGHRGYASCRRNHQASARNM